MFAFALRNRVCCTRVPSRVVTGRGTVNARAAKMAAELPQLPDVAVLCEEPRVVRVLGGNPSKVGIVVLSVSVDGRVDAV